MNKHVLLIGGGGYIGTVVSKFLLDNGCKVRILDNFIYQNFNAIKNLKSKKNFSFFEGDFAFEADIKKSIQDITDVVILGGLVGIPITKKYPELHNKINVDGMKNCLSILERQSFNKLIFIVSSSI